MIFIRGLSILLIYFHSLKKLTFLVSKGLLCLYDRFLAKKLSVNPK